MRAAADEETGAGRDRSRLGGDVERRRANLDPLARRGIEVPRRAGRALQALKFAPSSPIRTGTVPGLTGSGSVLSVFSSLAK